jgi:hypothetical protein
MTKAGYIKLVTILALAFFSQEAFAQYQIKGRVLNGESLEPVPFATVFLNNTSFGAITEPDGTFSFEIPAGDHELVISHVGFQPFTYAISTKALRASYEFRIAPLVIDLGEQSVESKRDPAWYQNYEVFVQFFLGSSPNAASCTIKNPEVIILDSESDPNLLVARATDMLQIENPSLGYDIKYVLTAFVYDKNARQVSYAGYPFFVEKNLPKRRMVKIEQNRKTAYTGSVMHLMRAVHEKNLEANGFHLFPTEKVTREISSTTISISSEGFDKLRPEKNGAKEILQDTLLLPGLTPLPLEQLVQRTSDGKVFITDNRPFFVYFTGEKEPESFRLFSIGNLHPSVLKPKPGIPNMESVQISKILMRAKAVQIFENGSYYHPYDLYMEGYMAWEKVADLLPFDYQPER